MTLVRLELTTFSLEGKRTIQLYNKALECPQPDLNRRPTHYKCVALPLRHRDISCVESSTPYDEWDSLGSFIWKIHLVILSLP